MTWVRDLVNILVSTCWASSLCYLLQ